jgi:hypothetical protein
MTNDHDGGSWLGKVASAVVVVLFVAAGARVAYELLAPLVPGLIILLILMVVFGVAFGLFRRR